MVYMVSYDLLAPESHDDYRSLYAALVELGFRRVLQSQWVVRWIAAGTAVTIRDILRHHVDANDRLLVTSLENGDWAGYTLLVNPNDLRQ